MIAAPPQPRWYDDSQTHWLAVFAAGATIVLLIVVANTILG